MLIISIRRVQKNTKATIYCIRFGRSLWSANQLPAQRVDYRYSSKSRDSRVSQTHALDVKVTRYLCRFFISFGHNVINSAIAATDAIVHAAHAEDIGEILPWCVNRRTVSCQLSLTNVCQPTSTEYQGRASTKYGFPDFDGTRPNCAGRLPWTC